MATVKLNFKPSSNPTHEGAIYYRVTHQGKSRMIHSRHYVLACEWDSLRSTVKIPESGSRRPVLVSVRDQVRKDIERIMRIIQKLEQQDYSYTTDDILEEYKRYRHEYTLFHYMSGIISSLRQNGKIRTSETYTAALNSFKKFLSFRQKMLPYTNDYDIMLDSINCEIMESYSSWLTSQGAVRNTISFYCRILRAVYKRAVDNGIIDDCHPFRHVYTGIDKTIKRAISIEYVKTIRELDLTDSPILDFARDMFMMSFYLRGMSFIDMTFLKKSDLKHDRIVYNRRKTGQRLEIAWTQEMQGILDKYPDNPTDYLLPIICKKGINERCAYLNAGYAINRNLKKIGKLIGLTTPLTMYVARHSWASAAKAKGIPLSVISEGMGHDNETTTLIYLSSLDTSAVDQANTAIIQSLM